MALTADAWAQGGKAVYVHADVSKAADCENMVRAAELRDAIKLLKTPDKAV